VIAFLLYSLNLSSAMTVSSGARPEEIEQGCRDLQEVIARRVWSRRGDLVR